MFKTDGKVKWFTIVFLIILLLIQTSCSNKTLENANSFIEIGDYSNAITLLENHLKEKVDDVTARKLLIICYESKEMWSKAIDQIKILDNFENNDEHTYKLLRIYCQLEQWDKYIELIDNTEIPKEDSLYTKDLLLAEGLYEMHENDDEYFIAYFEEAIDRDSTYKKFLISPIMEYLDNMEEPQSGEFYSEKFYYNQLGTYYNMRGDLYDLIGNYEKALDEYSSELFWFDNNFDSNSFAWVKYHDIIDLLIKTKNYDKLRFWVNQYIEGYCVDDTSNYVFASMWLMRGQIPVLPTVITYNPNDIKLNSVELHGSVITDGGSEVIEKGFCWNNSGNPTKDDFFIKSQNQSKNKYICVLNDLNPYTQYYVRGYAENSSGIVYGNDNSFRTLYPQTPRIRTSAANNISLTKVTVRGDIISIGTSPIEEIGVCWGKKTHPNLSDNKQINNFDVPTTTISNLQPGTIYYLRAYAKNNEGIGYGENITFSTLFEEDSLEDIDGNVYKAVKIGNHLWMAENLKVTHYRDGSIISNIIDDYDWRVATTGGLCKIARDVHCRKELLYNGYSVTDTRGLAPEGWHIPTDNEWKELESYIGMDNDIIGKRGARGFKEAANIKSTSWLGANNNNGNNSSGFNAIHTGYRSGISGEYSSSLGTYFWTSTSDVNKLMLSRGLEKYNHKIYRYNSSMDYGYSIRCVKDAK